MKILLSLLLFFLFILPLSAQDFFYPQCKYTSLGFSLKGSYAWGDIRSNEADIRPGFAMNASRRVSPRLSFFTELMWVRLLGDDHNPSDVFNQQRSFYYLRNLHFRNDIKDLSFFVQLDLFPSLEHYRKRPIYNFYVMGGAGIFYHNPRAWSEGRWVALRPLQTEGIKYSSIQMAVPVGLGFRYKLAIQWDIEVEVVYRLTSTDYLDDVSGSYVHPDGLKNKKAKELSNRSAEENSPRTKSERDMQYILNDLGENIHHRDDYTYVSSHAPGTKRGSGNVLDSYFMASVRLCYILPAKIYCPKFRE